MLDEGKIVEEVFKSGEGIIAKLSPWARFKAVLKKVLMFIITLKIILETLKLLGQAIMKGLDMIRQSVLLSLGNDTWKILLWTKFWRLVYGVIGGLLLEYNFQLVDKVIDLIEMVI